MEDHLDAIRIEVTDDSNLNKRPRSRKSINDIKYSEESSSSDSDEFARQEVNNSREEQDDDLVHKDLPPSLFQIT